MKFTEKSASAQKEILKRKLGGELFAEVTLDTSAFTNGVCKAGNPIAADGTIGTDSTAIGVLLNDVEQDRPVATILKAFGVVNTTAVTANVGSAVLTSDIQAKLGLIVFEA